MSARRTGFNREKALFSGIREQRSLLRHPRESGGPPALAAIEEKKMDSRFRGNDEERDASPEQPVDEPARQPAAAVADNAFAVDPVAAAGCVLDAVIIAQPG